MAKSFIQDGNVKDFTNDTGSAITTGEVVVMGAMIGIALVDIAIGAVGAVALSGVFSLPKASAADLALGEYLQYDISASEFVAVGGAATGDVINCGVAFTAAGNGSDLVEVKLNPGGASVQA